MEHFGEKGVSYELTEAQGVTTVDIQHQLAGVTHPIMGGAEVNDKGNGVLFSPAGSYIAPRMLALPPGTPSVLLHRRSNIFWMRGRSHVGVATTGTGDPIRTVQTPVCGVSRHQDVKHRASGLKHVGAMGAMQASKLIEARDFDNWYGAHCAWRHAAACPRCERES